MKLIFAEALQKHTQTSGVRNEIDEILAPILLAQRIYGLQILDPNWSWRKNAFSHICILALIIYVIIGTYEFIKVNDDVLLFSEAIFTVIITVQYPTKLLFFLHYRVNFREVYASAKTTILDIVKEISPERSARLVVLVRKMANTQLVLVVLPTLNYLIPAMWNYFNGTRVTLSRTTSTLMPMTSPYYELGLIVHLKYFILVAFGLLMVDLWFIILTYLFCEASECAIETLHLEKQFGETDATYAYRLNTALGKFYSVHVKLMVYLNKLSEMYKWQLLVPLISVLSCTCVFLLVFSEEPNWQIATVMLPASVEIFAYNLLGEKIKTKANDMNMALINFDWINMNVKDKKNYYIIVCYMNKNFGITSAIGMDLSLLTLSSVYKGAYQTFAVLNTMKS